MPKVQAAARMVTEAAENNGPDDFRAHGRDAGDLSAPSARVRHLTEAAPLGKAKVEEGRAITTVGTVRGLGSPFVQRYDQFRT
jgi:hypothetical protein